MYPMRSHHRSSHGLVSGRAWRALLLTLGLGLPAGAADPQTPRPAAPCTPEALFLGQGKRDFADASELIGGDGVPDLVLAVRGCKTSTLTAVEISAEDGTVLWDTKPDNSIWTVNVAARQAPERLLQDSSGALLPSALVWRTTPQGAGAELLLSVSGDSPRGQAFQSKPQGKVTLHYAEGTTETLPLQPAPSPLPPALAALTGPVPLDAAAVLRDFGSEDEQRRRTAIPRLTEAVSRLDPRESLPVLEPALVPLYGEHPDYTFSTAAARALRVLGPRALPAAPLLIEHYSSNDEHALRALSAMGPDVTLVVLGLPLAEDGPDPSTRKAILDALQPTEERVVRLLHALGSNDARAARMAEQLFDCRDLQPAFFERAAKNRATVKQAWRLLNHPTPLTRHLAAGVLMAAGERGPVVRREVKWGALECKEGFEPLLKAQREPRDGVFLAVSQGRSVSPLTVYRQGGWEPVLPGPGSGPSQWFPILPEAPPVRTRTKAVEYPGGCDTRYWALPLVDQESPNTLHLALSQKTEVRPIPEAPAELQSALQGAVKAHAADELRALTKHLPDSGNSGDEDPTAAWKELHPPQDARARCLPVTDSEWLCHATQERQLRSAKEADAPVLTCQSRFWLRGGATAMRIVQSSRDCSDPSVEIPFGRLEAEAALMLEGRAWWLLSNRGGFIDGDELWGPRGDSMERVATLFTHPETCD